MVMKNISIKMSEKPIKIGTEFFGEQLTEGRIIRGKPFRITGEATREEFISQFGPGEMTEETRRFLDTNSVLYFYRTGRPKSLAGLIALAAYDGE